MSAAPPPLAERILSRALAAHPARAAMLGDLREDFARLAERRGRAAANVWYWKEALLLTAGRALRGGSRSRKRGTGSLRGSVAGGLVQDAAHALRVLRRAPGFALFTAATIGLGVGAATSVFSVMRPLLIAPLPLADAEALVWIQNSTPPGDNSLSAVTSRTANLRDFRERARSFTGLTAYNAFSEQVTYTLTGEGEPERLVGVGVAPGFLDVLGVEPGPGRPFSAEEEQVGGPPAMVLAHGFWVRRFAADPAVVGRALTVNGQARTVVGVLPRSFDFASLLTPGRPVDFLLPYPVPRTGDGAFQGNVLFMIGRLHEGVSAAAAQAELEELSALLQQEDPGRWGLGGTVVSPLREHVSAPFRPALLLLAAAAATLLLIVCVNVSNLLLARAPARLRELAVRKAVGASRGRLVRQLLLESLALAALGALLGSGLAWGVTRLVARSAAIRIPLLADVRVEGSALLLASALALVTGLGVGALPALRTPAGGESAVLRGSGRTSTSGRGARRLRDALVFTQVALACTLLVMGGLLMRSFQSLRAVELGFEPSHAAAWQINSSRVFDETPGAPEALVQRAEFFAGIAARVAQLPGVEQVGFIDGLPLGRNRSWTLNVSGEPEENRHPIFPHVIDPGYLGAMQIGLRAGRNFVSADRRGSPWVVLINESGARQLFGERDPIGQRIEIWTDHEWEVVGVVADVRNVSPDMAAGVQVYFPMAQMPDYGSLDLVVRSRLPVEDLAPGVSAALRQMDPAMSTREFWTLESTVAHAVSPRRFTLWVLGGFVAAALLLAGLGIYGVLAQAVAERRAEIAVRVALGASAAGVLRGVVLGTVALAGAGVLAGALLALMGGRVLESLLFGVSPADPLTFAGTGLVLLSVAAVAAARPALRALRTPLVSVLAAD